MAGVRRERIVMQEQQQEPARKFSQEQYDMLIKCSADKDITPWNNWRQKHPYIEIQLEGASLSGANLEGARLVVAHLEGANLSGANLERAPLVGAHLEGAELACAHLEGANLRGANLAGAYLTGSNLEGAKLFKANLKGADLSKANLKGADLGMAIVDGETLIITDDCSVDDTTDFTGAGLRGARVEPELRARLEGNIRRIMWQRWYRGHRFLRWPVKVFWAMSNYGQSTVRVLLSFLLVTGFFAAIYSLCPETVANLTEVGGDTPSWLLPLRSTYFSVVVMTSGFGDMYANPQSVAGHIFVMLNSFLGYILLGALVTRLAVLFQEA
jgi:uncharacterized protein YjbI with pentapeptide repeats